jgi:hypothetical protein
LLLLLCRWIHDRLAAAAELNHHSIWLHSGGHPVHILCRALRHMGGAN